MVSLACAVHFYKQSAGWANRRLWTSDAALPRPAALLRDFGTILGCLGSTPAGLLELKLLFLISAGNESRDGP